MHNVKIQKSSNFLRDLSLVTKLRPDFPSIVLLICTLLEVEFTSIVAKLVSHQAVVISMHFSICSFHLFWHLFMALPTARQIPIYSVRVGLQYSVSLFSGKATVLLFVGLHLILRNFKVPTSGKNKIKIKIELDTSIPSVRSSIKIFGSGIQCDFRHIM